MRAGIVSTVPMGQLTIDLGPVENYIRNTGSGGAGIALVDTTSKIAANERCRGEIMLEFPGQQRADRHFARGTFVLGCNKVTLT